MGSINPLLLFLLPLFFLHSVDAPVHEYIGDKFLAKGNAFVLHGGSEGIYASVPNPNAPAVAGNGDSFIW